MDNSTKQMVDRVLDTQNKRLKISSLIYNWIMSTGCDRYFPNMSPDLVERSMDDELVQALWRKLQS